MMTTSATPHPEPPCLARAAALDAEHAQATKEADDAVLLALHRVLFPELHHPDAEPLVWGAEVIEQIAEIVEGAVRERGLLPHGAMWAQVASQWTTKPPGQRYSSRLWR